METIILAISAIEGLVNFVQKQREIEKQAGRLTPEQDAELDDRLKQMFESSAWKTDDQIDKE